MPGRNINNLRYADDTTLLAESEEELKSLLMKVKKGSEKVGVSCDPHPCTVTNSHHHCGHKTLRDKANIWERRASKLAVWGGAVQRLPTVNKCTALSSSPFSFTTLY